MEQLEKLRSLSKQELRAFLGWFAGGSSSVRKYTERDYASFGKAECEWVSFDDFWLKKMRDDFGWFDISKVKDITSYDGQYRGIIYHILPTDVGWEAQETYWNDYQQSL